MKFRKKPVVIDATQWFENGDHPEDHTTLQGTDSGTWKTEGKIVRYFRRPNLPGITSCRECGKLIHIHGWIDTKEGGHIVCPGDWIITGVHGEYYPCKPNIFAETYDPEGQ